MNGWLEATPLHDMPPGAVLAALVSGALLPVLGVWVVLQRVVFLGITLAQVSAAGVALGLVMDLPPLPLGLALCLVMVGVFTWRGPTRSGAGADTALGAAFCAASALALLFISRSPADMDEVHHVLHGNLIFADLSDVALVASCLVAALASTALFYRRVLFAAFDPESAAAFGLRARAWLGLLFVLLALALSVSMRTTGSLLTFALLVLPAMASLRLGRGMAGTFVLASVLGVVGSLAGMLLAVVADLHVESAITVTLFLLWPLAAAWRAHPALGLGAAALAVLATLPLRPLPAEDAPPLPDAAHDHVAAVRTEVRLVSAQRAPDGVRVRWEMTFHADGSSGRPDLWLVLSAGPTSAEVPLRTGAGDMLRRGLHRSEGTLLLERVGAAAVVTGQVWTGPTSALESLPAEGISVADCPILP